MLRESVIGNHVTEASGRSGEESYTRKKAVLNLSLVAGT